MKLVFAVFGGDEFDGCSGKVFVGGQHIEALYLGLLDDFVEWFTQNQA